jgi:hypothetical protein
MIYDYMYISTLDIFRDKTQYYSLQNKFRLHVPDGETSVLN